jgi:hypothetical protein
MSLPGALIAGLIERSHQGRRKSGRQATFSSDILYDTLRRYDPNHLLLQITREEALRGLIDFSRIEAMLARVGANITLIRRPRVTPLAAPLFFEPGRIPVHGEARDRLACHFEARNPVGDSLLSIRQQLLKFGPQQPKSRSVRLRNRLKIGVHVFGAHGSVVSGMTAEPILRACPENGREWDDPSEDLLFELLRDIEDGHGTLLIVERTTDPSGQIYAQVLRREDGRYVVEHREGDAEHHYGTVVLDLRAAHELLTGWAFEIPDWDNGITWSTVAV